MNEAMKDKFKVCGNPAGLCEKYKDKTACSFDITLRSKFKLYMTVPCYIRKKVNRSMGGYMNVRTEDEGIYSFKLDKRTYKTRIHGAEYNEFLEDFDMQAYDRVRLQFHYSRNYLTMEPFDSDGCPKERLPDEYDFENEAALVIYPKGVTPIPAEMSKINNAILDHGLGLGVVLVHVLTKTDIKGNGFRIPKNVVSVLGISTTGKATMVNGGEGADKEVDYSPTKDGRLCFSKSWFKFAKDNNLNIGTMVLSMFHSD